jgi:Pvc16 N-terminal domain
LAPMNPDAEPGSAPTISNFGAAAAYGISFATEALWRLLQRELDAKLPGVRVTARSPDKARDAGSGRQINLFLYHVAEDASRSDVHSVREGRPCLALNLHYLLTAYGPDDQEMNSTGHAVLTEAMRILHANPVIVSGRPGSVEAVRLHVALHPLNVDDLFKMWAAFQTPYQISVGYEVGTVLVGGKSPTQG